MKKKQKQVSVLTPEEKSILPDLTRIIRTRSKLNKPITNFTLRRELRGKLVGGDVRRRIQLMIHELRVTGKVKNLLASGDGYFISRKTSKKDAYKAALRRRIASLKEVYSSIG